MMQANGRVSAAWGRVRRGAGLVLGLMLVSVASAQTPSWHNEYGKRLKYAELVEPLKGEVFGERVNLYDGTTSFDETDISLSGNSALPVAIARSYNVDDPRFKQPYGDWQLEIPFLSGVFGGDPASVAAGYWAPASRCSTVAAPPIATVWNHQHTVQIDFPAMTYWDGSRLSLPGGGGGELLGISADPRQIKPQIAQTLRWKTKDEWFFTCLPALSSGQPGEGFLGHAPDGSKYSFDWMVVRPHDAAHQQTLGSSTHAVLPRNKVFIYPTQVVDRFGNWVRYEWQGSQLKRIHASDGREIVLAYDAATGFIASASAHGRTWSYGYDGIGQLTSVLRPDGSRWGYAFNPYAIRYKQQQTQNEPWTNYKTRPFLCTTLGIIIDEEKRFTVTHPSGAVGQFSFRPKRHGRKGVPFDCNESGEDGTLADGWNSVPVFRDVFSLATKTVSGPGLTPQVTSYAYEALDGRYNRDVFTAGFPLLPVGIAEHKVVTVTEPDGVQRVYEYGKEVNVNDGRLLSTRVVQAGTTVRQDSSIYMTDAEAANAPFPAEAGISFVYSADKAMSLNQRPIKASTIVQDGVTYANTVSTFNEFARPASLTRASTINGGYSRGELTTYYNHLPSWTIGQAAAFSAGGAVPTQTDYDPVTALPIRLYQFGVLRETLSYHADGTIATVKDGNDNVTALSNWKRGIPQTIQHPATAESPSGSTESVAVGDNGWIQSLTDENGYTTNYQYDAMGRLSRIVYPTGDSVPWNDKVFAFEQIQQDEFGIPPGHWRQVTGQGNYQRVTVFDALWRPLWEYQRDLADSDATYTLTARSFDHEGRETFVSYPRNPIADGNWAFDTGTRTTYDALGRTTQMQRDSELGKLTTTTAYQAGGDIVVTDPRGHQTRTRYAAWDQPTTDYPIEILHPEGAVTQITRELGFLKPKQITRSGNYAGQTIQAVRTYYYDGVQRLCRTDEPETGSTVMGYDNNDNMNWSAAGLSGLNGVDCDHIAAYNGGRTVTRNYDARNRLTQLGFPDGLGNQSWTYTKDGLPATITTYNGSNTTWPWINAYHYNKRRLLDGQGDSISQPGWYSWSLGYGYDRNGNLSVQTYPTGLMVGYAPNALGQATQVATVAGSTTTGTYASGVSYYPNGAIKQFTYGNGLVHSMWQNARQLPWTVSDGGISGFSYTYDKNGNAIQIDDNAQGAGFNRYLSYDGLDRLTAAGSAMFGGSTHYINYAYDPIDNLRAVTHAGVREHSYWYDANNRLTNVINTGGATVVGLSYDTQGNLNNKNGQNYWFSYGNRLREVTGKESYAYDGLGRRVQTMQADGTVRLFQYSHAGQYLFGSTQTLAGAQTTQENIYLAGSLIATVDHDWPSNAILATKYHHTDALGSPVATTDVNGALIERTNYEPYGSPIGKTVNGIGYTGHVMDGTTGLTYMQQRYYDPMLGKFLSVDAVTAYSNPIGAFNRYWYANNNPYRFTDPDGRQSKEMGRWIRALWDNNGDFDKAKAQVDKQHEMDRKIVETVVDFTAFGVVKDAVEIGVKVKNGQDATGQGTGAVAGEVAGQITEKVLDGKIGSNAASVVGAVVGKAVGDTVEAGVDSARQPKVSPPPPPPNPEVRNKVGDK